MVQAQQPPEILGLLSDPLRWQLLGALAGSDRRVGELVQLVGKPPNLVSYHLAELRRGGVVSARRSSADGRDVYYTPDLSRCRDLLGEAGRSLHPGLSLASRPSREVAPARTSARVLFLCTGNSARSQIAEAVIRHASAGTVHARSAGSHPKPLHPNVVRVMAERGIDIAGRPTKSLARFARHRFDRVITMCDKVREICPEFPRAPITAHWSIADPATEGADDEVTYPVFLQVADEIETRVAMLLAELAAGPPEGSTVSDTVARDLSDGPPRCSSPPCGGERS